MHRRAFAKKIAIIVFSPSGNTLKVARMIEENMNRSGVRVQLVDITRNSKLFQVKRFQEFLTKNVKEHDLLLAGAPVYAHHMHYNMIDIIKSLPKADGKWSKPAVPFVTYGEFPLYMTRWNHTM